jgi:hypothetical protein
MMLHYPMSMSMSAGEVVGLGQPAIVRPPETLMTCPVTNDAASLAKNMIAPERSSG